MRRRVLVGAATALLLAAAACSDADGGEPAEPRLAERPPATEPEVTEPTTTEEGGSEVPGTFVDLSTRSSGSGTVVVTGRASPGATVPIDGVGVDLEPDGSFSLELARQGERTTVEAVAEGPDGGRATATATVG